MERSTSSGSCVEGEEAVRVAGRGSFKRVSSVVNHGVGLGNGEAVYEAYRVDFVCQRGWLSSLTVQNLQL